MIDKINLMCFKTWNESNMPNKIIETNLEVSITVTYNILCVSECKKNLQLNKSAEASTHSYPVPNPPLGNGVTTKSRTSTYG